MDDTPAAKDFSIAVICALRKEADAVQAVFDRFWESDKIRIGKAEHDTNAYTTGLMGDYNVVLAHMPDIGNTNAALVAAHFRHSFPAIKIGFVVGICGGVPRVPKDEEDEHILLGDVIISTGVVDYTIGKQLPDKFVPKNTLGSKPTLELQGFLNLMQGAMERSLLQTNTAAYLAAPSAIPGNRKPKYPGAHEDKLFSPTYRHKHHELPSCDICRRCVGKDDEVCDDALEKTCTELKCHQEETRKCERLEQSKKIAVAAKEGSSVTQVEMEEALEAQKPRIHYGLIASGSKVMKSGEDRDKVVSKSKDVIAFEMEGAGVWETIPCFIIKGVCDYADCHKGDKWQRYAAATAAACMKAFLERWRPTADQLQRVSSRGE
jgi:nucleoside phosphorylase